MEEQNIKSFTNEERLAFAKSRESARPENDIHWSVSIGQNTVIGSDGFGYAREENGSLCKIPHRGNVVIEKDVEIGSNTCIDRAVEGSTVIGEGTKLDNLVHVAHGVKIGKHCLIVAGTVIGGSCEIGDRCFIGINASIKNKVRIGNDVTVGMGAIVLADVPDGMTVVGVWKGLLEVTDKEGKKFIKIVE
jgi:UDP-3-O-[3-hydroxymyristoyl] glucosamine N-acyltransferase